MNNDPEVNETLSHAVWPVSGIPTNNYPPELNIKPGPKQTVRIRIDKSTHSLSYDGESEHEVSIVIGPKE